MAVMLSKQIVLPTIPKKASDYAVGETVLLPRSSAYNDTLEFMVVHQGNPSSSIYDASCDGTWLLLNVAGASRAWKTTPAANDYENSDIDDYLNDTYLGTLATYTQGQIKQVKIPYRPGSGSDKTCRTGSSGLSRKIFLPSMAELGFSESYQPTNEGAKLSYFLSGTGTSAKNKRKFDGTREWWTRSPYCGKAGPVEYVWYISGTGAGENGVSTGTKYIRPLMVLNPNALFDSETNILLSQ